MIPSPLGLGPAMAMSSASEPPAPIAMQHNRRSSRGGLQTPALEQELRLPERVLESIFIHFAEDVDLEKRISKTGPIVTEGQGEFAAKLEVAQTVQRLKRITRGSQAELLGLLTLSKTTKSMVERALYLNPNLQDAESLRQLAESVQLGEARWDSLKNSPYSTPGRYITVLDLRHVLTGNSGFERSYVRVLFYSCLAVLFPSLPNLKELYLPEGCGTLPRSILEALQESPCIKDIKILHGLEVTHRINAQGVDPLVQLLSKMQNLKSLKVNGLGAHDEGLNPSDFPTGSQSILHLPRLRDLHVSAIKNGLLLSALVKSNLPELAELQINTYHMLAGDLTHPLVTAHGEKLRHLTINRSVDWPPIRVPAHHEILSLCPQLVTLRYLDRACLPPPETFEDPDSIFSLGTHPLQELVLTKWSTSPNSRDIPASSHVDRLLASIHRAVAGDSPTGRSSSFGSHTSRRLSSPPTLSALSLSPPHGQPFLPPSPTESSSPTPTLAHLKTIRFEEFAWLRPDLGPAALNAGINGLLRQFAAKMSTVRGRGSPVKVLDMHGKECPAVPVARGRGSMGHYNLGQNRMGMRGAGERRRPSLDGELDDESG